MNTFLPYSDFTKSAKVLDNKRLGKQRAEVWQIYLALTKLNYGWKNHPAVKMWRGFELALLVYGLAISWEWKQRNYKDIMYDRFLNEILKITDTRITEIHYYIFYNSLLENIVLPKFIGNEQFHSAMRSNLLRKDKQWYSQFNWKEPDNLPYLWGI